MLWTKSKSQSIIYLSKIKERNTECSTNNESTCTSFPTTTSTDPGALYTSQSSLRTAASLAWCSLCLVTTAVNSALNLSFVETDLPRVHQVSSRSRSDATYLKNHKGTTPTSLEQLTPAQPDHQHPHPFIYFLLIIFCICVIVSSLTTRSGL